MSATLTNPFAVAGRLNKAWTLAQTLRSHGVSHAAAKTMNERDWAMAAQAAGTKMPSEETQRIALEKLAAMEVPLENIEKVWDRATCQ